MISLIDSQKSAANDTAVVQRLARAIALSDGEFSLLLACCNSVGKQEQVLSLLKEFSTADIQKIVLSPKVETLYTNVVSALGSAQPDALVIRGLESVKQINQLIISTNFMRDEFAKQFKFPLILFVNEEILRKLIWLAPDLKDWAACTLRFEGSFQRNFLNCW